MSGGFFRSFVTEKSDMKSISITEKLIFYFVLIGLVGIISVGSYSYFFAKKALLNRTYDLLISLRLEKNTRVEQFFTDRKKDIYVISKSDEIVKLVDLSNLENGTSIDMDLIKKDSPLDQLISGDGYYQRLFVVTRKNFIYDLVPKQTDSNTDSLMGKIPYEKLEKFCKKLEISRATVIQDLSKTNQFIYIGTPVFDNKKTISGFVVLEIPINALNKIMFEHSENNRLGETGETYLVSDDYLMRSNSRFKGNAILNINVKSISVLNAFKGKTGVGIVRDYRNISCLSSYSKVNIEGLNWVIVAEIDELEAMTPVYSIRNSILLISIIMAAGIFILAFLLSISITAPLKRLRRASEQIGEGDYNVHLKISSLDELGMLTATFNDMVLRLKKQSEEIEEGKIKRVNSLLDGQEIERQRLARDLHDSLGQSILTANIKLEQARNADSVKSQQIILETQMLLKQIIQEIRNISNDLMPSILASFGIEQGLRNFCRETSKNTGIDLSFVSSKIPGSLIQGLQIYLFRITQEAVSNVIRHSGATAAVISLSFDQNTIFLSIRDNGHGFDVTSVTNRGNGILNIKERVKAVRGACTFSSSAENGTFIEISIPV